MVLKKGTYSHCSCAQEPGSGHVDTTPNRQGPLEYRRTVQRPWTEPAELAGMREEEAGWSIGCGDRLSHSKKRWQTGLSEANMEPGAIELEQEPEPEQLQGAATAVVVALVVQVVQVELAGVVTLHWGYSPLVTEIGWTSIDRV